MEDWRQHRGLVSYLIDQEYEALSVAYRQKLNRDILVKEGEKALRQAWSAYEEKFGMLFSQFAEYRITTTIRCRAHQGLVASQANKLYSEKVAAVGIELEDLVQAGWLGLMDAAEKYDPYKGHKFSTYATLRVHGAIVDFLRKESPLSQEQNERVKQLDEAREQLRANLEREPTDEELAETLGLSLDEIRAIKVLPIYVESLDDEDEDGIAWPPSIAPDQEQQTLGRDLNDCMQQSLSEHERQAFTLHKMQGFTSREVGDIMDTSLKNVSRYALDGLKKLRNCLELKGWDLETALGALG